MLTRSKGSWAQFVFVYRSHSTEELYSAKELYSAADLYFAADCFPLHFFLWTFLALWSSWWVLLFIGLSSSWYGFKNGHQQLHYIHIFFMLTKFQGDRRIIAMSSINCLSLSFCRLK